MGVPKFYRFMSERYPLINAPLSPPGNPAPKIDNLYLDMNGIIHNCTRSTPGNGGTDTKRYTSTIPIPKTPNEIFQDCFKYIDNLVALAAPTTLIYMAIDGVAPRAKMNQQRARRFRSAKERLDEHNTRLAEDPMYAAAAPEHPFDSNCITPGTSFMYRLTAALKYFVSKKITEDLRWANLHVILSGAEAPGEGEHKIMEYIRAYRESGKMQPNLRHCVYGLDADLIMLGLVTHEPHFFILREKIDYTAFWKKKGGPRVATTLDTAVFGQFELLSIGVFREYIALELGAGGNASLPYFDVERLTDDFVFILMLIGNDFLPNLPTLDIADGTLSVMLHLYKRLLPYMGGYLTHEGKIIPERLEHFFARLAMIEKAVMRAKLEEQANGGRRRRGGQGNGNRGIRGISLEETDLDYAFGFTAPDSDCMPKPLPRYALENETARIRAIVNDAELVHMKNSYYAQKFGPDFLEIGSLEMEQFTQSYVEGIWWTLRYYTEGCRHWRWFYPYHYAPFASDICGVVRKLQAYQAKHVHDRPFKPMEQLLSVLPPESAWCLPKPLRALMTSPSSPIHEYFPEEFGTDLNGKRNDWEAVVLLPFVEEKRLLRAISSLPPNALTAEEVKRNSHGPSFSYRFSPSWSEQLNCPLGPQLPSFTSRAKRTELVLPRVPDGQAFRTRKLPGTLPPGSNDLLSDLPFLGSMQHRSKLDAIGVNVFGQASRNQSIVLTIASSQSEDTVKKSSALERIGVSIGGPVWFGYPWRAAGTVEHVSTAEETKRLTTNGVEVKASNQTVFERDVGIMASNLLQGSAVDIGRPSEIVGVRIASNLDDPLRDKADEPTVRVCDPQFIKRRVIRDSTLAESLAGFQRLHVGQTVMYVGSGVYFGHLGVVRSVQKHGLVKLEFKSNAGAAKEPAFGYRVVKYSSNRLRWMTLSKLCAEVGLHVAIVEAFLGSIRVSLQFAKEEVDLGLGIKYGGRGLYIPGYVRRDQRQYFSFSDKTADLLRRYRAAFPHLFTTLESLRTEQGQNGNGRLKRTVYSTRDLFGSSKKADDAARAASTWISVQEVAGLPLVPTDADVLSKSTVQELQRHWVIAKTLQQEYERTIGKLAVSKRTKDATRQSLLTGAEGLNWGMSAHNGSATLPVPADGSGLYLGDRVVNRIGNGGVPFGMRGTVVGIYYSAGAELSQKETEGNNGTRRAFVEVVFDDGFIGGSSLNGRCSDGRGKAVAAQSLYVLYPDRENQYYVKNYARIAAKTGISAKKATLGRNKTQERLDAIAHASVMSYAEALRKPVSTANKAAPVGQLAPAPVGQMAQPPATLGHSAGGSGPGSVWTGRQLGMNGVGKMPSVGQIAGSSGGNRSVAGVGWSDPTQMNNSLRATIPLGANGLGQHVENGNNANGKTSAGPAIDVAMLPLPSFVTGKQREKSRVRQVNGDRDTNMEREGRNVKGEAGDQSVTDEAEWLAKMLKRDLGIISGSGETCSQAPEMMQVDVEAEDDERLYKDVDEFVLLWMQLQREAKVGDVEL